MCSNPASANKFVKNRVNKEAYILRVFYAMKQENIFFK